MSYTKGQKVAVSLHSVKDEPATVVSVEEGVIYAYLDDRALNDDTAAYPGMPLILLPAEVRPA